MIDIFLVLVLLGVAYFVANEGPFGAAFTFLSVLLSGIIAINFFEPLAMGLTRILTGYEWDARVDIIAYLGLFSACVFGLRAATDALMPTFAEIHSLAYDAARWTIGVATGYLTMAIILTALHTAPLPRNFANFTPERKNFIEFRAPDREWLAFNQYLSDNGMQAGYKRVFDGSNFERITGRPDTAQIWSSFPIRYAMRRELFAAGGAAAPGPGGVAAPGVPGPPVVVPAASGPAPIPQGGGGGGVPSGF